MGYSEMQYSNKDHTFVVCAYKDSPYLIECLQSVTSQTCRTNVIISTSTPNQSITNAANRFGVNVRVNAGSPGIAHDWNEAVKHAATPLVTIAHQDDVYDKRYAEHMLNAVNACVRPLIFFTNYAELRNGVRVTDNMLLSVKRMLLTRLKDGRNAVNKNVRRRALSLGSAICCPSVTLVLDNLPLPVFQSNMKSNLDWEAWERLSQLDGSFYYDSEILTYHRIHRGSETSALIGDDTRTREDLWMLEKFWPKPVAQVLNFVYRIGQSSNNI